MLPKKFMPLITTLSRVFLVLILFSFLLFPPLGVFAAGDTFPGEPFNGMQITYQVSGASVTESEDTHDFTTSRVLKGELGKGKLTITGTAKMGSGYSADVTATVTCGDKTDTFSTNIPTGFPDFNEESFSISVPIPKDADKGSFSISMVGHYNAGTRGLVVSGEFLKETEEPSEGHWKLKDEYYQPGTIETTYNPKTTDDGESSWFYLVKGDMGNCEFYVESWYEWKNGTRMKVEGVEFNATKVTWSKPPAILIPGDELSIDYSRTITNFGAYGEKGSADVTLSAPSGLSSLWFKDPKGEWHFRDDKNMPQTSLTLDGKIPQGKAGDEITLSILMIDMSNSPIIYHLYDYSYNYVYEYVGKGKNIDLDSSGVLGNVGNIPSPEHSVEALVGILAPGLLATLLTALAGLFGNGSTPPDYHSPDPSPSDGGPPTSGEREWMEVQLTPLGSKTVIEKDPETGQWINIQTGGVFDLEKHQEVFPQMVKAYEDSARRNLELEKSGKTAMQESLNEIRREYEQREATFEWLQKIQKASQRRGLDTPGAANNMYGRIREEIEKLNRGEDVDFDRAVRIRNFIGAHTAGAYGSEDAARSASEALKPNEILSIFDIGGVTDRELWSEAAAETGRNVATLSNSDGSFSWKGLAGRIGINILTLGRAEKALDIMAGLYATKDAVDNGETSIGAITAGAKTAVDQFILGKIIGTGVKTAGGAIGGFSEAGVKGAIKGGKDGLVSSGRELVNQAKDLVSKNAWKNTASGVANSVKEGATRLKNIITGKEGYVSTTGPKTPNVSAKPSWDQKTANELNSAVKSGDHKKMTEVYNKIGRKEVSKLQVKGAVSGETVEKFNRVIGSQVDDIVDKSTIETIESFQKAHRVRVSEIVVADSGSSAKGSVKRALTDFDRTTIPKFDKADVLKYAEAKNISPEKAYNELCHEFSKSFDSNVKSSLKNSGLNENAVKFDTYDRIGVGSKKMEMGAGAKNIDTYGAGYTGSRLSTQGKAKVFRVDANGQVDKVYNVSGQSALDRSVLNNQEYVTKGKFPQDPTKITKADGRIMIRQQLRNVSDNPQNPVEIAKSIGRTEKGVGIISESTSSLEDPNLTKAAALIYDNPSNTNDILIKFGFVDAAGNADVNAFMRAGIEAVNKAGQEYAG